MSRSNLPSGHIFSNHNNTIILFDVLVEYVASFEEPGTFIYIAVAIVHITITL